VNDDIGESESAAPVRVPMSASGAPVESPVDAAAEPVDDYELFGDPAAELPAEPGAPADSEAPGPAPGSAEAPGKPPSAFANVGHGCGVALLLFGALVVVLAGSLALAAWVGARVTTGVPSVTGLRVPDAIARLNEGELATATMGAFATTVYQRDVVIQQLPTMGRRVVPGTPVDLLVAVAPTATVVPDLYCDSMTGAAARLESGLLKPVFYEQLSDTVPYGRVVDQMPRAGQRVMTGQQVALFVSMGRGTRGAVVPNVRGKTLSQAAAEVASVYLVAVVFDPKPDARFDGTVTDQAPAPGSRVPVGTAVPLLTTGTTN
jgi:beta-lactam-binding protein with PASTA domain